MRGEVVFSEVSLDFDDASSQSDLSRFTNQDFSQELARYLSRIAGEECARKGPDFRGSRWLRARHQWGWYTVSAVSKVKIPTSGKVGQKWGSLSLNLRLDLFVFGTVRLGYIRGGVVEGFAGLVGDFFVAR